MEPSDIIVISNVIEYISLVLLERSYNFFWLISISWKSLYKNDIWKLISLWEADSGSRLLISLWIIRFFISRNWLCIGRKNFSPFFKTLENVRINCSSQKQKVIEIILPFTGFYFSCHLIKWLTSWIANIYRQLREVPQGFYCPIPVV